jgi:hypothetical protein
MQDLLNEQLAKFNERMKTDEKLQKEMEGIERKIQIEVTDGGTYFTILKDKHVDEIKEGTVENPEIVISADENKSIFNHKKIESSGVIRG